MVKRVASGAFFALALGAAVPFSAGAEEAGPAVTVVPVANACLQDQVFFTGLLMPREEVLVMPLLEGAKTAELLVEEGDKVKVTLRFRGRELAHPELGMKLLQKVKADFEEVTKVEYEPRMEGRQMIMILAPR